MARLEWGLTNRLFDEGLDRGVLYSADRAVPWNGLVSVEQNETSSASVDLYYEGQQLLVTQTTGDYSGKITAYTYPDEFEEHNGYSEREMYKRFGLSYRTQYGDSYKLHLVYSVLVDSNERAWSTLSNKADPSLFAWSIDASAVPIPGARPSAQVTMEHIPNSDVLSQVEDILYGTKTTAPRLPSPEEVYELYESATMMRIVYHGDGSYTASGPDSMVRVLGNGAFELDAPSVFLEDQDIFRTSSY